MIGIRGRGGFYFYYYYLLFFLKKEKDSHTQVQRILLPPPLLLKLWRSRKTCSDHHLPSIMVAELHSSISKEPEKIQENTIPVTRCLTRALQSNASDPGLLSCQNNKGGKKKSAEAKGRPWMLLCLYHLQDHRRMLREREDEPGSAPAQSVPPAPHLLTCALAPDTPPGEHTNLFPFFFFLNFIFPSPPPPATFTKSITPLRTS